MILPTAYNCVKDNNQLTVSLELDGGMKYLEGHFDHTAVLAGVVQIGWVIELVERAFDLKLDFLELKTVKYTQLVLPPTQLDITIQFDPEKEQIKFKSSTPKGKCASGMIIVSSKS